MFVKPVSGRMIRWPRTFAPLADAGEHVPDFDSYWLRALNQGDVALGEPEAAAEPASDEAADHPAPATDQHSEGAA